MNNRILLILFLSLCSYYGFSQGTTPQYPGPAGSVGYDTGCGGASDGVPSVGTPGPVTADAAGGAAGTSCNGNADFTVDIDPMFDNGATGFDIPVELTNFQIDETAAYDLQVIWFPANNNNCGCGVCFDLQLDLGQGTACGTFGTQPDLSVFEQSPGVPYPTGPINWGADVLGIPAIIEYTDLCPNTQYDVWVSFNMTTSNADVFDPADNPDPMGFPPDGDGDGCALDADEIVSSAQALNFVEGPFSIIGPGERDPMEITNFTATLAAGSSCTDADIIFDVVVDISAGCYVPAFDAHCSLGLEAYGKMNVACGADPAVEFDTGPLIMDPVGCYTGFSLTGQIIVSGADICAALECDPNATFDIYATHTFCEAMELDGYPAIQGGNPSVDDVIASVALSTAFGDAAVCCAPQTCASTYDFTGPTEVCSGAPIDFLVDAGCDVSLNTQDLDAGPPGTFPSLIFDLYIYAPGGVPGQAPGACDGQSRYYLFGLT